MNTSDAQTANVFGRVATLAASYGIDPSALFDRLTLFARELADVAIVGASDRFDRITVATQLPRTADATARLRSVCDAAQIDRVARLGVDTQSVYLECDAVGGTSPTTSVQMFGKRTLERDLALLALEGVPGAVIAELREVALLADGARHIGLFDTLAAGEPRWTVQIAQDNRDDQARARTRGRVRAIAERLGLSKAGVNAADGLHDPLAKEHDSYLALTVSRHGFEPMLSITWSAVAWEHVVRMMIGFYPGGEAPTKLGEFSGAFASEAASAIELELGRSEPPRMRVATILTKGRA